MVKTRKYTVTLQQVEAMCKYYGYAKEAFAKLLADKFRVYLSYIKDDILTITYRDEECPKLDALDDFLKNVETYIKESVIEDYVKESVEDTNAEGLAEVTKKRKHPILKSLINPVPGNSLDGVTTKGDPINSDGTVGDAVGGDAAVGESKEGDNVENISENLKELPFEDIYAIQDKVESCIVSIADDSEQEKLFDGDYENLEEYVWTLLSFIYDTLGEDKFSAWVIENINNSNDATIILSAFGFTVPELLNEAEDSSKQKETTPIDKALEVNEVIDLLNTALNGCYDTMQKLENTELGTFIEFAIHDLKKHINSLSDYRDSIDGISESAAE